MTGQNPTQDPHATVHVGSAFAGGPRGNAPSPPPPARQQGGPRHAKRHSNRLKISMVLVGLVALLGIAFGAYWIVAGGEDDSVATEAPATGFDGSLLAEELVSAGHSNVLVTDNGAGSVTISGEVPDLAARDDAHAIVAGFPGVQEWSSELTVVNLPPALSMVTATDTGVTLTGAVTTEDERTRLRDAVAQAYSSDQIDDQMVVDPDARGWVIEAGGTLTDAVIFKELSRSLAAVGNVSGSSLNLALGADEALNSLFESEPILFQSGTAVVVDESLPSLDDAAELLLLYPNARLEVGGHTDSRGSDQSNLQLSQERAEAIVNALRERGVSNELSAVGFGESQLLVSPDDTPQAQQANRRIVFKTFE